MKLESLSRKLLKISLSVAVIFALLVSVMYSFTYYWQTQEHMDDLHQRMVNTVMPSASIVAFVGNQEIAKEVGYGIAQHPEILGAEIVSEGGFTYRNYKRHSDDYELIIKRYPIHSPVDTLKRDLPIGELLLAVDKNAALKQVQSRSLSLLQITVLQVGFLLLTVVFVVRRYIAQPLKKLIDEVLEINPGNGRKVELQSQHASKELYLLGRSVNQLLSKTEQALDIERQLKLEIAQQEQHYRAVMERANIGSFRVGLDKQIRQANSVFYLFCQSKLGLNQKALDRLSLGKYLFRKKSWPNSENFQEYLNQPPQTQTIKHRSVDGKDYWLRYIYSLMLHDGEPMVEGIVFDVTNQVTREKQAVKVAQQDALTKVANRSGCEHFVSRWYKNAQADHPIAVLSIDLDGFKSINDSHGHHAGDQVLKTIARRLSDHPFQTPFIVSRFGGDEFVIVMTGEQVEPAWLDEQSEAILAKVTAPITLESNINVSVGMSIGIARQIRSCFDLELLLITADQAMYKIKKSGKTDGALQPLEPSSEELV